MATRQTRTVRTAPPVNGEQMLESSTRVEEESPPSIPPQVDGLESLMAELSSAIQAKVTVYRVNKTGPATYVYQCSPEAFNLDDLRDKHGGGDFRLYVTKDGDFFRNLKISVEPTPIAPTPAATPRTAEVSAIAALEARLARQDEMIQEFCRQNLGAPQRQSILGDLDLPATISAISAAIVALRPPAPPPPPPASDGGADRAIDMLLKGIELAKELKSDSGDGDSMMGVLRDLVKSPLLAQAVSAAVPNALPQLPQPQQGATMPQPVPQRIQAQPQPRPVEQPAAPYPQELQLPQSGVQAFDAVGPLIVRYLPMLCYKAQEGSSSELYAEVILDSVPPDMIDPILERTTLEITEYLFLIYPPGRPYAAWLTALIEDMRRALEEGDEEGEPLPPDLGPMTSPPAVG